MMIPITSHAPEERRDADELLLRPGGRGRGRRLGQLHLSGQRAQEEMAKIDPELAENPFIFPSAEYIADTTSRCFRALTREEETEYSRPVVQKVMGN